MAIFTVTTGNDVTNPGDGVLSLREAITQANATPGADEIVFGPSITNVTIGSGIGISNPLTISGDRTGDGVADVTLRGFTQFNRFDAMFFNDSTTLMRDLRIEDFVSDNSQYTVLSGMGVDSSGAIFNSASLTLERVQFDDIFLQAGPGAQGLMPLKAPDGSDGTPPTPGDPGGSGTGGQDGGYAYLIGNVNGSLTLTDVGFGQNVRIFGGTGGTGGTGGEGGNGGDGELDILSVLASGGAAGGNGGQGGAGGTGGVAGYVGLFAGSTLSVTQSVATGGVVGSFGGAGGTGGAGGAGGDGYSDIFQSFPDGPAGSMGFSGPNGFSGSTGFAFSAPNFATAGGTQITNFNPQLHNVVAYINARDTLAEEGELFTVNFSRVGRTDVPVIVTYEFFPGSPGGFTVDDIGNAVLSSTEVIAANQFTLERSFSITDDMLTEGEEGFFLAITSTAATGLSAGAGTGSVAGAIAESDQMSTIDLTAIDMIANEGETVRFEVVRTGGQGGYDVEVEIVPGPGVTAADFGNGLQPFPEIIPIGPGGTGRQDLAIFVTEDMLPEGQESFEVRITSVTPAPGAEPALIGNATIAGTILDTGPATRVDLVPVALTVDEGSPIRFDITRSGDPFSSFTVDYALVPAPGSGFGAADLAQGAALTGQALFGIRTGPATPDTLSVSVPTLDDMLAEGAEAFTVEITGITVDGVVEFSVEDAAVVGGTTSLAGQINASDPLTNAAPVAVDDSFTVGQGSGATALAVLTNDTDADGNPLTVTAVTQPANGTASTDGSTVSFTPAAGFSGATSLSYTISDGAGGTDEAMVAISVAAAGGTNTAPTGLALSSLSVAEMSPAGTIVGTLSATDADGDPLTFSLTDSGGGRFAISGSDLVVAGALDFETQASVAIVAQASDGRGGTASAGFTIAVTDVDEGGGGTARSGTPGDDSFDNIEGAESVSGLAGTDVIVYDLPRAGLDDEVLPDGRVRITELASLSEDLLDGVEIVRMRDGDYRFDILDGLSTNVTGASFQDNLEFVYRLYAASLGRTPGEGGLSAWLERLLDGRQTRESLADAFVLSPEFQGKFGGITDAEELITLYFNEILDREPAETGLNFWAEKFRTGSDLSDLLTSFAVSPEFERNNADNYDDGVFVTRGEPLASAPLSEPVEDGFLDLG